MIILLTYSFNKPNNFYTGQGLFVSSCTLLLLEKTRIGKGNIALLISGILST